MDTWKIVIGIVVLFALGLIFLFDVYCREKYNHAFFSKRALCISMAAVAFFIGGDLYRQIPDRSPNELVAVSWSLFAMSAAIFVYLVVANVKATNYWVGLGGSAIQIPLLAFVALHALALLAVCLVLMVLSLLFYRPEETASEKRKREDHDDWWYSKENKDGPNYQKPSK